eukprot:776948_1
MNDVWKHCKLHKWGDINEWKQGFQIYKDAMNSISVNGNKLLDTRPNCKIWKCKDCGLRNPGYRLKCLACYKDRFVTKRASHRNISINSISSSLIGKNVNQMTKNNLKQIQKMIDIQNTFLTNDSHLTEHCDFFDLRPEQLIDTTKILNIIRTNCKPWICYDTKNKLPSQTYLTFNIERIENEIKEQCIDGRNQLKIKYRHFECIGSKNMLR